MTHNVTGQNVMLHSTPWSDQLRPSLGNLQHLTGHARRLWERDLARWRSGYRSHLVFWGPPGCGKTTLALLLCESAREYSFRQLSGVSDGLPEIKKAIEALQGGGILFIDEIHRLTRPQQDVLLPALERGSCWLVAATTENPAAVLSPALLSRIRTQRVHPPSTDELLELLRTAMNSRAAEEQLQHDQQKTNRITSEWLPVLARRADGDVRLALNLLDGLINCSDESDEHDLIAGQLKAWTNKAHYDYASAMIKSMRGSDPDAALFYAIAALESGEDPLFLLRRCIIFASEDVGNSDPAAIRIAIDCYTAFEKVGLPEGRYALAQAVCYLASTVKSNRLLRALNAVTGWWKRSSENSARVSPPTQLVLKGHEKYRYPHDYPRSFVREQYLPEEIESYRQQEGPAYIPSDEGAELRLKERLKSLWNK